MRRSVAILLLSLWPALAGAQDTLTPEVSAEETARDRSYLTGLIEDNLSSDTVQVRLEGFEGALSSRATFDTLTIADADGVWITIRNGAMAWERGALLSGRIQIGELSADEIDLPRLPNAGSAAASPEVTPFFLPELPVSVELGRIQAKQIKLGAPVIGQALTASLSGSIALANGEGSMRLEAQRSDAVKGRISIDAGFTNATRQLTLDLLFDEAAGGVAAQLLGLPGAPAITLAIAGDAPLEDYTADIVLSTDGQRRLVGSVALQLADPDVPGSSTFAAKLEGNLAPLFPAEYQPFFGETVSVLAEGKRAASGRMELSTLDLRTNAFELTGKAALLPGGLPERADLNLRIALPDGGDVPLPLAGEGTTLRRAALRFDYDATQDDAWSLDGQLIGLNTPVLSAVAARLSGSGRIRQSQAIPSVGGTVSVMLGGVQSPDPALAEAIGPFLSGQGRFSWAKGMPLRLSGLSLTGQGYALALDARVMDPSEGLRIEGTLQPRIDDLSRLSALVGRPLSGAISGAVEGQVTALSGAFDAGFDLVAQSLAIGQAQVDPLLTGQTQLTGRMRRDQDGISVQDLELSAEGLDFAGSGHLNSEQSWMTARARLPELGRMGIGFGGQVEGDLAFEGAGLEGTLNLDLAGSNLSARQSELHQLLGGRAIASLGLQIAQDRVAIRSARVETAQLDLQATGVGGEDSRKLALSARLVNMAVLAPGFPGPVTIDGTLDDLEAGYQLALNGAGPGGTKAQISGLLRPDLSGGDLAITGQSQSALANAFIAPRSINGPLEFDLRLDGPFALSSLSGRVGLGQAVVVAPNLGLSMKDLAATVQLASGQARVDAEGSMEAGGRIGLSGRLALNAPFSGDLGVTFDRARFRDPELYDSRVSGKVDISGPLAGGARIDGVLTLSETELQVPSSGLGGAGAIPEITHLGEPGAVHETRRKAGLLAQAETRGGGADFPLDVTISSERAIFVRGRGLDAELGGMLRVTGSTNNVIPLGDFNLIRGRLDILGKRFVLDEGRIALQGALIPWVSFAATTKGSEYSTTVAIEGPANEPEIRFSSVPELPEEEVLARLLFDRGLTNLSPLQAAQLAAAVATLAGKGGGGIINKLRETTGLDDLDVSTDESGAATVRAGKYISDNLYTDVAIDSQGKTEINLNLDLTPNLTARGSVTAEGETGIGIFFEKDY